MGLLQIAFDPSAYEPHGFCFEWNPGLVGLHVVSDSTIGLSYVAISLTLLYFVLRLRGNLPFHWVFLAFGGFIVACGCTHFMEVATLWTGLYWISGSVKAITAVASLTTAVALPRLVPQSVTMVGAAKVSELRRLRLEVTNADLGRANEQKDQLLATLTHILDGMTEAVCAIGSDLTIKRLNQTALAMLGRSPEVVVGARVRDVFRLEDIAGRLLEEDEYACSRSLQTGTPEVISDCYFRRVDGSRMPVSASAAPVADNSADTPLVVLVIRDISRQREAEQLKDRIISLVSHELRTPIGHIMGFASSLLEDDVEWDAATQRDFIAEIGKEADRLAILVRDLLDMSKIESGQDFLQKGMHAPAELVDRALRTPGRLLGEHSLVREIDSDLPDISVDASQIERVITNLVENAAKYAEPGTEVRLRVEAVDEAVRFCVSDQGPGIPVQYREQIFDRFFRIRTERPTPGTGLGLPICKGIVEAHGGRLWFEDGQPHGSRFYFTVPLQE